MARRLEGIVMTALAHAATWHLVLILRPWREVGGEVQRKELRLLVPMPDRAGALAAMAEWKRGKAVALTLTSLELPSKTQPSGLAYGEHPLESFAPDEALRAACEPLARRLRVDHVVFGPLIFNPRTGYYEGGRRTPAGSYDIFVQTPDPDDPSAVDGAVARSARIAQRLEEDLAAILDAVADKLELYNATWREERPVLSREEFRRWLKLSSVEVSEVRTTAHFACGDFFADHQIEVRMAPDGRISEICISG